MSMNMKDMQRAISSPMVLPSGTELMTLPGQMERIIMTSDDFWEDKRRMSIKYAINVSSH